MCVRMHTCLCEIIIHNTCSTCSRRSRSLLEMSRATTPSPIAVTKTDTGKNAVICASPSAVSCFAAPPCPAVLSTEPRLRVRSASSETTVRRHQPALPLRTFIFCGKDQVAFGPVGADEGRAVSDVGFQAQPRCERPRQSPQLLRVCTDMCVYRYARTHTCMRTCASAYACAPPVPAAPAWVYRYVRLHACMCTCTHA